MDFDETFGAFALYVKYNFKLFADTVYKEIVKVCML